MATRSASTPGKSSSLRLHFFLLRLFFISSFSGPGSSGVLRRLVRLLRLRLDPYVSWLLLLGFPLFSSFGLRGSSFSSVLTSVVLDPARPSSSRRGHAAAKGGRLRSQLHVDSRGKSSCLDFVCLFLSSVPVSFFLVVSSLIVTVSLPGSLDLLQLARQPAAAAGQGEGRGHRVPG